MLKTSTSKLFKSAKNIQSAKVQTVCTVVWISALLMPHNNNNNNNNNIAITIIIIIIQHRKM